MPRLFLRVYGVFYRTGVRMGSGWVAMLPCVVRYRYRRLQNHQVVAVDYFALVLLPELACQPAGGTAHQAWDLFGVVVHQAAGYHQAILVGEVYRVAGVEDTLDADDAGREQGGAAADHRFDRALVQLETAARDSGVGQPQQARARALAGRGE